MSTTTTDSGVTRRAVLRGATSAATAGLAVSTVDTVAAQAAGEPDYGGWFENTSNYEGTIDETGQQTVTITVGTEGNDGNWAFDPAAVRIDPGTEIVWEWSGKGGAHNVAAEDGSFESELTDEAGFTFTQTVESTGILKYACTPHKQMGMKGALVVGTPASDPTTTDLGDTLAIGGGFGLVSVLLAMFAFGSRTETRNRQKNIGR